MPSAWTHLIRFIAKEDGQTHLGQIDPKKYPDVGLATYEGKDVEARLVTGSAFDGAVTDRVYHVAQVCCPSSVSARHRPFCCGQTSSVRHSVGELIDVIVP